MLAKLIIISLMMTFSHLSFGESAKEFLNQFDSRIYNPKQYGLNDLSLKVRIKDLTKQLNEQLVFGKLKDVYFELYWKSPDKVKVEVIGMPKGFKEVKSKLAQGVLMRMDFIIPRPLSEQMKDYEIKLTSEKGKNTITATDTRGIQQISEILYLFDENQNLTRSISKSAVGMETFDLKYDTHAWSQNKKVLEGYKMQRVEGVSTVEMNVKIKYKKVSQFGFPESMELVTKQILTQPQGKSKTYERESKTSLSFFDHKVNTGLKNIKF